MDRLEKDEALALAELRARDFWSALVLIAIALFFLWKTSGLSLGAHSGAGVSSAGWYTSAAVVPFGIFGALLVLALVLLGISIRSGGAAQAMSGLGLGWNPQEASRIGAIGLILLCYIVGLVPRVDFILGSALLITALICGFHGRAGRGATVPVSALGLAGGFALLAYPLQSDWAQSGDDWVTLGLLIGLTVWHQYTGARDRALRLTPVLALGLPLLLICAMAFGFRQNVPNRSGLIFSKIEYTYYVHLRPLWRS